MLTNNKILVALAGVGLTATLVVGLSYHAFNQIDEAAKARRQTFQLIILAETIVGNLVDAETGQRGYLLTDDTAFLKPYQMVGDLIEAQFSELRLLATNDAGLKHLNTVAPVIKAKMADMAQSIELRRHKGVTASLANVLSGQGMQLMDTIRTEMQRFILLEESALTLHEKNFQSSMRRLLAMLVAASGLGVLFAVSFVWLLKQGKQNQLDNLQFVKTRNALELLEKTNNQLQQTFLNLQISEEKLAVTLQSIGDGVIATDAEARVVLMNPLAERLTGWALTEAAHRPIDEIFKIFNSETRQPALNPVIETLARGATHGLSNHTMLIARGGDEWAIADSCAPIRGSDGLIKGAVLVFRDVTERAFLDQVLHDKNTELEHSQTIAEKANRAKTDFLSAMSHELRTPLNAILGFAQLMESGVPPPTPLQKRSLDQILKAGWYLLELINEILDLALIESGKVLLSREPVSLIEVMLECQTMIEPQAQQRGITMTFPQFDVPYFVKADRTRIKQVLINLLSNAIKYNKPDGGVAVEYAVLSPDLIRICVRDTGTGLAPEQIALLFQPFNRLGKEAGSEEGTGIGLVVTKRLVELMDGVIGVESTVGVGSLFWIELSLTQAPQLVAPEPEQELRAQVAGGAPLRTVLYVEDNPANLELVEQLIARRPDLRLLSAATGNIGVEFARAHQPAVILMDINLPGISGVEAMKILRADPSTAHIPVVALSANAQPRDIEKSLEAGFSNYLTKPIRVNEFMEALDTALLLSTKTSETTANDGESK